MVATREQVNEALKQIFDIVAPLFPDSYEIDIEVTPCKTRLTERSAYQSMTFVAQKPPLGKEANTDD